jgi:hypothetical protein
MVVDGLAASRNDPKGTIGELIDQIPADAAGKKLFVHSPPPDDQRAVFALLVSL